MTDNNDTHVVLDIETTGFSKRMHAMTEIAAIKVKDGKIIGKFHTLVNPETHIPSKITEITGITDEMVKDAPVSKDIMPDFVKFVEEYPIIAHNATFDHGFLNHHSKMHTGKSLNNTTICTMKLANRIPLNIVNKKLGTLCEHFNIDNNQAHRALSDTLATVELFTKFREILEEYDINTLDEIKVFEMQAPKICRNRLTL